jgi:hypothetical protein
MLKDFIIAFLGQTLNMPNEGISENLFNKSADGTLTDELLPTASQFFKDKYKEHLASIAKPVDEKAILSQGRTNGYAEAMTKVEKLLKEKTGLKDTDKKGDDLILEAIAHLSKSNEQDVNKIKTHPAFLERERELLLEKETGIATVKGELEKQLSELNRKNVLSSIHGRANQILNSLKPVLPSDKTRADFFIDTFRKSFENLDYEEVGGEIIVKKDGVRLEDDFKHPIKFEDLVKKQATLIFDFEKQDGKQSPANMGQNGAGSTAVTMPKTSDEYYAFIQDRSIPFEQRKAVMDLGEPKPT